jgi:hypothetical protein
VACYEDDDIIQQTALDLLQGKIPAKGKLPVTVCDAFKYGAGIVHTGFFYLQLVLPNKALILPYNLQLLTPLPWMRLQGVQRLAAWC